MGHPSLQAALIHATKLYTELREGLSRGIIIIIIITIFIIIL